MRLRRIGRSALALVTGLGLAAAAAAADPPPDDSRTTWHVAPCWKRWFHPEEPAPEKPAPKPAPPKETAEKPAPAPRKPSAAETAASAREREEKAYLRRLAVCLKLHEIAETTKDEELERKASELEARNWTLYTERTHRLAAAAEESEDTDEAVVEKHLGPGGARGTPSDAPTHTVSGRERASRAAAREDER